MEVQAYEIISFKTRHPVDFNFIIHFPLVQNSWMLKLFTFEKILMEHPVQNCQNCLFFLQLVTVLLAIGLALPIFGAPADIPDWCNPGTALGAWLNFGNLRTVCSEKYNVNEFGPYGASDIITNEISDGKKVNEGQELPLCEFSDEDYADEIGLAIDLRQLSVPGIDCREPTAEDLIDLRIDDEIVRNSEKGRNLKKDFVPPLPIV